MSARNQMTGLVELLHRPDEATQLTFRKMTLGELSMSEEYDIHPETEDRKSKRLREKPFRAISILRHLYSEYKIVKIHRTTLEREVFGALNRIDRLQAVNKIRKQRLRKLQNEFENLIENMNGMIEGHQQETYSYKDQIAYLKAENKKLRAYHRISEKA